MEGRLELKDERVLLYQVVELNQRKPLITDSILIYNSPY